MSHNHQSDSTGVSRTKILLLGLRRSGKTSIQQVLFNSMTPKETFYLDATMRIVKHTYDTIIPLEIWDCPGNITVETLGVPLSVFSTLVFVIDIRDLYNQPISRLVEFIIAAYHHNPSLNLEIFVHKAEKLQEDEKIENFRQINERVMDRLMDDFIEQQLLMNFYLTSIFDHSLHQAFSKVLQRLTDSLPYLEELLNIYCANSQASKVFLFDAPSRLYVASDASPVDTATYNLCCDNLAMINAFGTGASGKSTSSMETSSVSASTLSLGAPTTSTLVSTGATTKRSHHPHDHDASTTSISRKFRIQTPQDLFYPSGATSLQPSSLPHSYSSSTSNPTLILLVLLPTSVWENRRGLVELNVIAVREGVQEIVDLEREGRGTRIMGTVLALQSNRRS
ncbi:Gtr1/RagA G protein Gtr2 [Lentinula lateritia]|nr:Gtr1/RagA G protein Gtr2 [Lentinula lateritia]